MARQAFERKNMQPGESIQTIGEHLSFDLKSRLFGSNKEQVGTFWSGFEARLGLADT
jgi:hypothetical protein